MGFRHRRKKNPEIPLSDGIVMKQPLRMETSSWLKNCMGKSVLVFCVIFGALGCFLSAFGLEYYVLPTALILFSMAFLFTTIYYRGWVMDLAYIIFAVIFFFLVRTFQTLINGGYYLILNRVLETAEDYFDLPGMQYYETGSVNEPLAVSMTVVFVGTVMMIVANVIISRTMNVWFLLVLTGFLWLIPLYFRLEPDALFVVLLAGGYLAVWAIRSSGAYGIDRKYRTYRWKAKKGKPIRFQYVQDAATMLETTACMLAAVLLVYGITAVIAEKDTFQTRYLQNPYKTETETALQEMSNRGFSFLNRYAATGGISGGQLGGVSRVSMDYQTDLIVTFAPYSYDPIYLKAFTGTEYNSAESRWETITSKRLLSSDSEVTQESIEGIGSGAEDYGTDAEADRLQEAYAAGTGARGYMLIQNVGATFVGDSYGYSYTPYYTPTSYSDDGANTDGSIRNAVGAQWGNESVLYDAGDVVTGTLPLNQTALYEYYPLLDTDVWAESGTASGELEELQEQAEELYLDVPAECYEAVAQASAEAGIQEGDTQEEIIQKVKDYFETEFLYTTRPGRTPENEDFVTWFLEKKKGYCAHFATAAVMLYRYNGIPARYVEGYVITYEDVMGGDLNEDYAYEDFYQGASPLGETGVVDVEITDARAHAWVEVFAPFFGWVEEEVTTAAIDPEEETDAFWDVFGRSAEDTETDETADDFQLQLLDWDLDDIQGIWIALLAVLLLLAAISGGRRGYRAWKAYRSWHTEDANENVLAYYQLISGRLRKKDAAYGGCPTRRQQLSYVTAHCPDWNPDTERLIELLEQAGYSRNGLSDAECAWVMENLEELNRRAGRWRRYKK